MPRSGSFILGIKWKSQGLKPLLKFQPSYKETEFTNAWCVLCCLHATIK